MKVEEKLKIFSKRTINEAELRVIQARDELKEKLEKECNKYRLIEEERAKDLIKREKSSTNQIKNKEIMQASIESKASLIDLRTQLIEELFERVNDELANYIESDEYKQSLINQITYVTKDYSDETEIDIYICKRDMIYADELKIRKNINILSSEEDIIGGFTGIIKEKNIAINNSFKQKLLAERKNFIGMKIV